jgi:phosphate/sulfate permease
MSFKSFAQNHFNAAFALKCVCIVAAVALVSSLFTPIIGLGIAAAAAPVIKDMVRSWNDERVTAKQNMSGKLDNYEPSTPRMSR